MFYISCRGSGATQWIAQQLSKHKKIVCFNSSRSFPPMFPGEAINSDNSWVKEELPVNQYIESLELCSKATRGEKIFGSIHGYHGITAKAPCEKRNGIFRYIIRNPLEQIHSAFIAYCDRSYFMKHKKKIKNENIHEYVCSLLKDEKTAKKFLENKYEKNNFKKQLIKGIKKTKVGEGSIEYIKQIMQKPILIKLRKKKNEKKYSNVSSTEQEKEMLSQLFVDLLRSFFMTNNELFNNCPSDYGFKMEELTQDKNYFGKLTKIIAPEAEIDAKYLNLVFSGNKDEFNIHRKNKIFSNEIWTTFPNCFKEYYNHFFSEYEMNKICDSFNYDYSFL